MTIAIDGQGVHAIVRNGNKLSYVIYNVSSGRVEQDNPFPSDTTSFMGLYPQLINLVCAGEVSLLFCFCYCFITDLFLFYFFQSSETILILRDGNSTIYPLSKDCADAIRDPQCLDLPPVKCLTAGTFGLTGTGLNMKNQVAIVVFALEQQLLMPKILRCDIDGVRQVLAQVDSEVSKYHFLFVFSF